jgi:hypothetical protein
MRYVCAFEAWLHILCRLRFEILNLRSPPFMFRLFSNSGKKEVAAGREKERNMYEI